MPLIHHHQINDATLRGEEHGVSVSLILAESEPGEGPRLHRHAYDETWVIQEGNISFQVGENVLTAGPGDVAIIPPRRPAQVHQQRPRSITNHLYPRQPIDRRRMARVTRGHAAP